MKPGLGQPPVTFDGGRSDTKNICCLLDGEAAKVTQLNHARFLLVECRQSFERVVERDEFRTPFNCAIYVFVQGELLKILPAFLCIVFARVIHQQATHYLSSNAEKVSPVLPVHSRLVYQTQVSLVHQSGRLQGVIRALTPQIIRRKLSQLIVDYG